MLNRGQSVSVVLGGQGQMSWRRPVLMGRISSVVLRRTAASGGYPGSAAATATFVAVRPGTARVISYTDAACLHAKPVCEIPVELSRVTVVVRVWTSGAGQGAGQ